MGKHLVLVGGGHAHLTTLKKLKNITGQGHQVTLVSPSPFHDYSGMGPGLLAGHYRLADLRFNIADMARSGGGHFIEATAVSIDTQGKQLNLSNGTSLAYDIASLNTGSRINMPFPPSAAGRTIFTVKPIANLFHARQKILESVRDNRDRERLRLLVIGGGPAGCEITGNLQALRDKEQFSADILQVAGRKLLGNFSPEIGNRVRSLLAQREYRLIEGRRVTRLQAKKAHLDNGQPLDFDIAFVATGITPNIPDIISSHAPPPLATGLPVNSCLQATASSSLFAGGDCIDFVARPLDKVGVYAVRQNLLLFRNLQAALNQQPLDTFTPQESYLLILNLGLHRAVALRPPFSFSGRPASFIKSMLDRSFVSSFQ